MNNLVSVRVHLLDADALDELNEAAGVTGDSDETMGERFVLYRDFFHVTRAGIGQSEIVNLGRVPIEGEFLTLPLDEGTWYQVETVLHTPGHPSHVAELWAVEA